MAKKKRFGIFMRQSSKIVAGRWSDVIEDTKVEVMAEVEGYAMVRRPKCAPFVVSMRELKFPSPPA